MHKCTLCRKLTLKRGVGAKYVVGACYVLYGINGIGVSATYHMFGDIVEVNHFSLECYQALLLPFF